MTSLFEAMDVEALLDAITDMADQRAALDEQIKALTVHAVHHLGARRYSAAAAASISRPTLNAWLDEYAKKTRDEWEIVGS